MKKYVAVMRILFEKITNSGMEMSDEFDRYEEIFRALEAERPKEEIADLEFRLYILNTHANYETPTSKLIAYYFRRCISCFVHKELINTTFVQANMACLANLLISNNEHAPEGAAIIEHMLNEVDE